MTARRRWIDEAEPAALRERAEAAARRAGMSLGSWLDAAIEDAAEEAAWRERRAAPERRAVRAPVRGERDFAAVYTLLQDLAERVETAEGEARSALELAEERLARRPARAAGSRDDLVEMERRLEAAQADLFAAEETARRSLREAAVRTRELRTQQPDERFDAMASAVGALERRIGDMMTRLDAERAAPAPPLAAASTDPELMAVIRERLDALSQRFDAPPALPPPDDRLEGALRALEGRMADIAVRLEASPSAPALPDAFRALEDRMADIAVRLETPPPVVAPPEPAPDPVQDMRLARIEAQLAGLAERLARPPEPPAAPEPALRPAAEPAPPSDDQLEWSRDAATGGADLADAVRQIADRQKTLEAQWQPAATARAIDERFQELSTHIGDRIEAASNERSIYALQDQVRALAERLESARSTTVDTEQLSALQRQIIGLHRTLESAVSRTSLAAVVEEVRSVGAKLDDLRATRGPEPELGRLEDEMRNLRRAVEQAAPREAFAGLEERIADLVRRLDGRSDPVDPATFERMTAQTEEVKRLISVAMPPEALGAILGEVRRLDAKLDDMRPATDAAAIEALRREIVELRDHLGRSAGQAPVATERLIADIRSQIGDAARALAPAVGPDLGAIETQIHALASRLDAAQGRDLGQPQIDALESQIAGLSASLGDAARSAAREAVSALGGRPAADGHDAVVRTLETNLSELRSLNDATDRRAQETLVAVHDTLKKMAQRLATLEAERDPPAAREAIAPAFAREPEAPVADEPSTPAFRDMRATVAAAREAAARASQLKAAPQDRLGSDLPLEPGSGRPLRPLTAAEAVRAAREQIRGGEARPGPETQIRKSFIAAARRAAQTAAADVRARLSPAAPAADAAPEAEQGAAAPKKRGLLGRFERRHIVMAMAALVIVLGAVQLLQLGRNGGQTAPPAPTASRTDGAATNAASSGPTFAPTSTAPRETTSFEPPAGAARPALAVAPAVPEGVTQPRLRAAAEAGEPRALYEIGARLADGIGLPRDPAAAMAWFRAGGEREHAPSLYRLGNLAEKGQGVPRDVPEAIRQYQRAADLGNRKAMHNLAALYAAGAEGRPDYDRAFPLFQRAAELGLVDSQYNLAVLMVNGLGTRPNPGEAYGWFAIAAQNGDREAERKRDEIAARLDGQALVTARLAAQSFRPRPFDASANEEQMPASLWEEPGPARGAADPPRTNLGIEVGATGRRA